MRLTLTLLGFELDITLGPADAPSPVSDDQGAALNGGTAMSTPVGFTPTFEQPDEMPLPMRNNGWGDEGNRA